MNGRESGGRTFPFYHIMWMNEDSIVRKSWRTQGLGPDGWAQIMTLPCISWVALGIYMRIHLRVVGKACHFVGRAVCSTGVLAMRWLLWDRENHFCPGELEENTVKERTTKCISIH